MILIFPKLEDLLAPKKADVHHFLVESQQHRKQKQKEKKHKVSKKKWHGMHCTFFLVLLYSLEYYISPPFETFFVGDISFPQARFATTTGP